MLKRCAYIKIRIIFLGILIMSFVADNAFAISFDLSRKNIINLHGFLSQAYLKTDENNFLGSSEGNGSLDYTEIGVNLSYSPFNRGNIAMQLLSRRAGETDNGEIKLDFLLFDYRVLDKSSYNAGFRVGRVKNPFGLFNDTRDVSFTRESIILPQSIYFERTRDLSISSDGIEVYFQRNYLLGMGSLQFVAAQPRVSDINTELALFERDFSGDLNGDLSYVSRLMFDLYSSNFKIAYSNIMLDMKLDPAVEFGLTHSMPIKFRSDIFSIHYSYNAISFTSEYAIRQTEISAINRKTIGNSYYIQLAYQLNFKWNIFIRNDVLYQDKKDKSGAVYAANTANKGSAHYRFADDVTLGAQFKFSSAWMFRAELHTVDGTAWLPIQDNPELKNTSRSWKMFSVLAAYRF